MTLNKDVLYKDPTEYQIPNLGVSKVSAPRTPDAWKVLEWELGFFVCEGQFERGLERILDSYLTHLSQPQQPAVWVSGFYGSGKSHLVRVLEHIWRDTVMPSGETARSLVNLPPEISAHLTELSNAGKRVGGLWSAAGTLGAGKADSVALAFLSVILDSAGLPQQYPPARFAIWLKQNSIYDLVGQKVKSGGKDFERELRNFYVSPILAEALLEASPGLADSTKGVHLALRDQFPPTKDIDLDELLSAVGDVLELESESPDKLPLTVVVLDEMQQYISEDSARALDVQNIVEACASRFESQVLFVATGQSALTGASALQKVTDRFAVQVELSATDVQTVIRQLILRKKPDKVQELKQRVDKVSGEIDRQLGGTKIAPASADGPTLIADYPLLPARRRFWEWALRQLDRSGKADVLRTQLKIVHETTRGVANEEIGYVIGGDAIYFEKSPDMLRSGVLLKDIDELIRGLREGNETDHLKSRICALVFLISQLPREGMGDIGLRSTAAVLADLLVEDLEKDGDRLRAQVPDLLEELREDGKVSRLDDEYRLQTEEGAEWEKDFRRRRAEILDDVNRLNQLRNERLIRAVDEGIGGLKIQHGDSKTPRSIKTQWGDEPPPTDEESIPVWIRDEWSATESDVRAAAAAAGDENPTIFVFLPRIEADAVKEALSSHAAANDTVQQRPMPQTNEGREALRGMKSRVADEEERLGRLLKEVVASAKVLQGGGNQVSGPTLREAVHSAAERSLARMFPKFKLGDNANWSKVMERARSGAPDALTAVVHEGEIAAHPVCKEILAAVSPGGTKGSELQKRYTGHGFGWPKDAVNGALLVLFSANHVRVDQDGIHLNSPKELPPTQIGKSTFFKEDSPPSLQERMSVRGILTEAKIQYEAGQEGSAVPALLQHLLDLSNRAGGNPPLPERPSTALIDDLRKLAGNQQLRSVADHQAELKQHLQQWGRDAMVREKREAEWARLERLLRHAYGLSVAESARERRDAIEGGRQILGDPNPIQPLVDELTNTLRAELQERIAQFEGLYEKAISELQNRAEWAALKDEDQGAILIQVGLKELPVTDSSSDEKLLLALDETSLSSWDDRIKSIDTRVSEARRLAAQKLEPKSVTVKPPPATLKTEGDVGPYLESFREEVMDELDKGNTVII